MTRLFEDCKERRGEPVTFVLHSQRGDQVLAGTIEWGDEVRGYSVCTEPAGARFIVQAKTLRPDPGGERPLWKRRNP